MKFDDQTKRYNEVYKGLYVAKEENIKLRNEMKQKMEQYES